MIKYGLSGLQDVKNVFISLPGLRAKFGIIPILNPEKNTLPNTF